MSNITLGKQNQRRPTTIAISVALGLLLVLAVSRAWSGSAVSPHVVEGWAMPTNAAGTAVSLHASPDAAAGEGYLIAGAQWRDIDDVWHDGADIPSCVGTDSSSRTHVRLGFVTVETPDGGTRDQVTWLECLE